MDELTFEEFQMHMLLKTGWQQRETGDDLLFPDYVWENHTTGAQIRVFYPSSKRGKYTEIRLTRFVEGSQTRHKISIANFDILLELLP